MIRLLLAVFLCLSQIVMGMADTVSNPPPACVVLDFESENQQGKPFHVTLGEGAEQDSHEFCSGSKSLKIAGTDNPAGQMTLRISDAKISGDKVYGLFFRYKSSPAYPLLSVLVRVTWKNADGERITSQDVYPFVFLTKESNRHWLSVWRQVQAPPGAARATIEFFLGKIPVSATLWLDDLSFTEVDPYEEVNISFENWATKPDKRLILGISPGAEVIKLYKEAHSGENSLVVEGQSDPNQYSAMLENVWVKPNTPYELTFYYRTTPGFPSPQWATIVLWQYNTKGEFTLDGWSKIDYKPQPCTEWKQARFELLPREGTSYIRIGFRLNQVPPGEKLFIDDIVFRKASPQTLLDYRIDPDRNLLSGKVSVPGYAVNDFTILLREYDAQKNRKPVLLPNGSYNTDFSVHTFGKEVRTLKLTPDHGDFELDLSRLSNGKGYVISASATLKDGRVVSRKDTVQDSVFYVFKKRPWDGNDLGVLGPRDPPPAPWKPIRWDSRHKVVAAWNNEVTYSGDLSIQAMKPLTRPIALTLNGRPLSSSFTFSEPQAVYQSPHKVSLRSRGTNDEFELEVNLTVEFDCFVRYKLTFLPKKDGSIEQAAIALSLPKDFVENVDAGPSVKFHVKDKPHWGIKQFYSSIWCGNNDAGIDWCADRIIPAEQGQTDEWIALDQQLTETALTVRLINRPTAVKKGVPLSVEFALLPTPTRPLPERYREMRHRTSKDPTMNVLWNHVTRFRYFGFPEAASPELLDNSIKTGSGLDRGAGANETTGLLPTQLLFYMSAGSAMETIPEVTYFRDKWLIRSSSYSYDSPGMEGWSGNFTVVDMGEPGWSDLLCAKLDSFLRRYPFDGIYLDVSSPTPVVKNGAYYCPILETRELLKRLNVIVKRHRPNGYTFYHCESAEDIPFVSFSDWLLTGERFQQAMADHAYYMDFLRLNQFPFECSLGIGPAVMFLPQYVKPEKMYDPRLACHVIGLVMLHDMEVWPSWASYAVIEHARDQKLQFGNLTSATFYPYWKPNPFLRADKPETAVSCYDRNGELFIVAFNNSSQEQTVNLSLLPAYFEKYGRQGHALVCDPIDNHEQAMTSGDGPISFALGGYLAKIVRYQKAGHEAPLTKN